MSNLSEQDYQNILSFLYQLYDTRSLKDFSGGVSNSLPQLVSGDTVGYCKISFSQEKFLEGTSLSAIPDDQIKEIVDDYFLEHPIIVHQAKTGDFQPYKLSDFVNEQQLYCMEGVYHKFLAPIGMKDHFSVTLPEVSSREMVSICLLREERSFSERDRTILTLIQPHLVQAQQTAQFLCQLEQTQQDLRNCLNTSGSIILDQEGHVQKITPKAEYLLKQYFPSAKSSGQTLPERLKQWVNYQRSLLSDPAGSLATLCPLKIEQNGRLLNVRFATDVEREQYMLLLSEQKSSTLTIEHLEIIGLSTREAEVLFWTIKGQTNTEIANVLHVSVSTVRKHLEHIYSKLGVHTRAGAVVEAFRQLGMLNETTPHLQAGSWE